MDEKDGAGGKQKDLNTHLIVLVGAEEKANGLYAVRKQVSLPKNMFIDQIDFGNAFGSIILLESVS